MDTRRHSTDRGVLVWVDRTVYLEHFLAGTLPMHLQSPPVHTTKDALCWLMEWVTWYMTVRGNGPYTEVQDFVSRNLGVSVETVQLEWSDREFRYVYRPK